MKALVIAAALGVFALPASAAMETVHFTEYSVTYDTDTVLGGLSFNSGGDGATTFGWSLPSTLVANAGTFEFVLPTFTLTANSGYSLSGALGGFLGNLSFAEPGNDETGAWISGTVSMDGSPGAGFFSLLDRTELVNVPGVLRSGYYSLEGDVGFGSFSSVTVSDFVLTLDAGASAAVFSTNQGRLEVRFFAAPVPEPETYAMLLAGLGLVSMVARRRMSR